MSEQPKITEAEVTAALEYLNRTNLPEGYHALTSKQKDAVDRQLVRGLLITIAGVRPMDTHIKAMEGR